MVEIHAYLMKPQSLVQYTKQIITKNAQPVLLDIIKKPQTQIQLVTNVPVAEAYVLAIDQMLV